jgi:hypothetical protein
MIVVIGCKKLVSLLCDSSALDLLLEVSGSNPDRIYCCRV